MVVLAFLPACLLGSIGVAICYVLVCVELAERRRARAFAVPRRQRRLFRPRVIQGGKVDAPPAAEAVDKRAG